MADSSISCLTSIFSTVSCLRPSIFSSIPSFTLKKSLLESTTSSYSEELPSGEDLFPPEVKVEFKVQSSHGLGDSMLLVVWAGVTSCCVVPLASALLSTLIWLINRSQQKVHVVWYWPDAVNELCMYVMACRFFNSVLLVYQNWSTCISSMHY